MTTSGLRSKGVLFGAIGLITLAVAVVWGNLGGSDSNRGGLPTESPKKAAQIGEILFGNDAVKGILEGRHEGRDYWVRTDLIFEHADVENTGEPPLAAVQLYFEPPVSWQGEVPTQSDPCQGHYDDDGWLLNKNDPCLNEPRQYGTSDLQLDKANTVSVHVDLRLGQVVYVGGGRAFNYAIREAKKGYATPGSPEQDARVREILFQHEAVREMTAGKEDGENYWVGVIGYVFAPGEPLTSEEKTIAMVNVYFDPPLDWSGPLPTRLDPCERERRDAQPGPEDACWTAPPQYEVRGQEFSGGDGFYADIDLRANEVLEISGLSAQPEEIDAAKARYAQ